ncbi:hypothetical protein CANTEDRAFT_115592, partial [Yamadazyma tenuis ATCC 10573]
MDDQTLSPAKQTAVDEFIAITGSSDDNVSQIIRLLDVHNWDLNNSIVTFFESGFIQESSLPTPVEVDTSTDMPQASGVDYGHPGSDTSRVSRRYSMVDSPLDDLIPSLPYAPRISNHWQLEVGLNASKREVLRANNLRAINSLLFLLLFVPKKLLSFLYQVFKFIFKINTANYFPAAIDYESVDLDHKMPLSEYVDKYNIVEGNFNEVYEQCKTNYTWLLVVLVNGSQEASDLLSHLLSNHHFEKHFNKANHTDNFTTCIYINDVEKNPESYEVGRTYKVKRLPFVMLINNVSNSPHKLPSMSITYKSNLPSVLLQPSQVGSTAN